MSVDTGKPPSPGGQQPFTAQDALAFMQRMWNPFGIPMPGFGAAAPDPSGAPGMPGMPGIPGMPAMPGMAMPHPAAMFAALDPVEIEKKIHEMRVIENWLIMSVNLMQMSIRTLELQKASLEALRAATSPKSDSGPFGP